MWIGVVVPMLMFIVLSYANVVVVVVVYRLT